MEHNSAPSSLEQQDDSTSWPADFHSYTLLSKIGQGSFASVWLCSVNDRQCAVKVLDLDHVNTNFIDIRLEVQTMRLSSHPNILQCYASFIQDTNLWLVTQLMNKGSSLNCIQAARRNIRISLEQHITFILHQTITGLKYFHDNKNIHRDLKAGNILLDADGNVRIADFGVSGWLCHLGKERENTRTFVGTPAWMAPEVMEQIHGYDYKADIWSLGITALELVKGYAPYAKYPPMKVLLLTIQEEPPSLETYTEEEESYHLKCSESFKSMIDMCLQKDPTKRPTCDDLLKHIHLKPLENINVTKKYKERIKCEICDQVESVNSSNSERIQSQQKQPGDVPIFAVPHDDTERRPHTSWVFSDGSDVMTSPNVKGGCNDNQDFFDEFEQSTQGENFVHPSVTSQQSTSEKRSCKEWQKEGLSDINDFMDQFEKETQGEYFLREK